MTVRRAVNADSRRLFDIRLSAITAFASPAMSPERAAKWAHAHRPDWADQILRERDIWVYETDGVVAGWISATGAKIDGLYTDPAKAGLGIASCLLTFVEKEMVRRGHSEVRLEASVNAERFYARRGYMPTGPRLGEGDSYGAQPMRKQIGPARPS